jgi:hypothetical protein
MGPIGTPWLDAPGVGATAIHPELVRLAALDLLCLGATAPVADGGDAPGLVPCSCGQPQQPGAAICHCHSCTGGPGGSRDSRHHDMMGGFDAVYLSMPGARRTGIAREPAVGAVTHAGKPDRAYPGLRLAHPHNLSTLLDAVVTDPCNASGLRAGAAGRAGAAAEAAAARKVTEFAAKRARLPGAVRFVPFAVEVHGGLNAAAVELLRVWSIGKANVEVLDSSQPDPGERGDAGARAQRRAVLYRRGWLRLLSATRVRAVYGHVRRLLGLDAAYEERLREAAAGLRRQLPDDSRIYHHIGARSCRVKLCLEGGDWHGDDIGGDIGSLSGSECAARFLTGLGLHASDGETTSRGRRPARRTPTAR